MQPSTPAPMAEARHIVSVRSDYRASGVWEVELGSRTYAWGTHGAGKTRLLGAIRFALTGTIGDAGGYDNLSDPGRFGPDCSPDGEHLFAAVTFDNGDVASTSWTAGKEPVVVAPPWLAALGATPAERVEAVLPIQALRAGLLGRAPAAAQQWLLARAGSAITVAALFAELPRARWAPLRQVLEGLGVLQAHGGAAAGATVAEIEVAEATEEEGTPIADLPWVVKAVADGARDMNAAVKAHTTTLATAEARLATLTVSTPGGGVPDAAAAKAAEAAARAAAAEADKATNALRAWREEHAATLRDWRIFAPQDAARTRELLAARAAREEGATTAAEGARAAAVGAAERHAEHELLVAEARTAVETAGRVVAEAKAVAAATATAHTTATLDLRAYDEPLVELRERRGARESQALELGVRAERGARLVELAAWQRDKDAPVCVLCGGAAPSGWTWAERHATLGAARNKVAAQRIKVMQEELPEIDRQIGTLAANRTAAISAAQPAKGGGGPTPAVQAALTAMKAAIAHLHNAEMELFRLREEVEAATERAARAVFLGEHAATALALYTAVEETRTASAAARATHTTIAAAAAARQEAIKAVRDGRDALSRATDAAEGLGKLKNELAGAVTRLAAAQIAALEARVQRFLPPGMRFGLELGAGRSGVRVGLRQPGGRLRGQMALYGSEWLVLELAMSMAFARSGPLAVYLPQDSYERACTGAHLAAALDALRACPGQVVLTGLQALGLIEGAAAERGGWRVLPLAEIAVGAPRTFEATEGKKGRKAAVDTAIEGAEAAAEAIIATRKTRRKPAGTAAAAMTRTETAFRAGDIPTDMEME